METTARLALGTKVRVVGGYNFGAAGTVVRILSKDELKDTYYRYCPFAYLVEVELWPPTVITGGSIALIEEFTEEALARAEASGQPFEVDSGRREMLFAPEQIKRYGNERFWQLHKERKQAHHGEVRRRANRACNLWRCHKEERATEMARSCHALNLLLSAQDSPPSFKGPRLRLNQCVALCCAAGKGGDQLADILYHLYFENRKVYEVEGILPRCTCTLN